MLLLLKPIDLKLRQTHLLQALGQRYYLSLPGHLLLKKNDLKLANFLTIIPDCRDKPDVNAYLKQIPPEKTLITPVRCKLLWKQFKLETDYTVAQAIAAQVCVTHLYLLFLNSKYSSTYFYGFIHNVHDTKIT
jgi:hypothetical protein